MASLGLNQGELASRTGVTRQYVSLLASGQSAPGAEFLAAIRTECGVSLDWLLLARGGMLDVGGGLIPAANADLYLVVDAAAAHAGTQVVRAVLEGLLVNQRERRTRTA